jgi:hypothetical protein
MLAAQLVLLALISLVLVLIGDGHGDLGVIRLEQ